MMERPFTRSQSGSAEAPQSQEQERPQGLTRTNTLTESQDDRSHDGSNSANAGNERHGCRRRQRQGQTRTVETPTAASARSVSANGRSRNVNPAPPQQIIVALNQVPLHRNIPILNDILDAESDDDEVIGPQPLQHAEDAPPIPPVAEDQPNVPAPYVLNLAPETRLLDIPFSQFGTLLGSSPTVVDIPSNLKQRVTAIFVKYMLKIVDDSTDVISWKKWLLLPVALFSHSNDKFKADMRKRSDALMNDQWDNITLGMLRRREILGGGHRTDGASKLHKRVLRQVKAGNLSKAMGVLKNGDNYVRPSNNIVNKLQEKNVVINDTALLPGEWETVLATNLAAHADFFIEVTADQVVDIVTRQRKLIKHGLGGLRYEHLVAMMGKDKRPTANQTQFRHLFARMITFVANARVPQEVAPALRDNEIIAAPKGNDDVRPIVPTCVIRKIASTVLFQSTANFNIEHFKELQFALKKCGTEHIINTMRVIHERHPGRDVFAMDGDNAFNRVSRRLGLQSILALCPQVFPFLRMLYGTSGRLWYYGMEDSIREIANVEGFLQGDGLALWAYIMTVHPFLHALKQHVGLDAAIMFYVDDGNIAADFDVMMRAIQFIEANGNKYGYVLKKTKGSYLLGKCADRATAVQRKTALVDLGFSADIIHIHPDNAADEADATDLNLNYGVKILGSYIGSDKFIKRRLHEKAVELTELGSRLVQVPHKQSVMLLFRYCYCPMVNHLMRTISPRLLRSLVKQINYCKREMLARIMNYTGDNVPARVVQWSQFSIAQGGLGLGCMRLSKHAAFAASFSASLPTIKKYVPDVLHLLENQAIPYLVDIKNTLVFIRETGGFNNDDTVNHLILENSGNCHKLQEVLTAPMVERAYNACINSEQLSINVTAWMKSIAQPEAGLFLEALPKTPETTLTDPEFVSVFNYRYLLTQTIIPNGTRCICANRPTLDLLGHHAMTGCKCGGGRQNTHDMIKHMVTRMCRYACVKSIEEEIGIFRATDPGTSKRPDVTVERGPLHPLHIIVDVTVTCPLPGAAGTGAPGLSRAQAGVQGRAAEKASQGKITKYGALLLEINFCLFPLSSNRRDMYILMPVISLIRWLNMRVRSS